MSFADKNSDWCDDATNQGMARATGSQKIKGRIFA